MQRPFHTSDTKSQKVQSIDDSQIDCVDGFFSLNMLKYPNYLTKWSLTWMINLWKLYVVKTHRQKKFAIHHNEDIYFSDVELICDYIV